LADTDHLRRTVLYDLHRELGGRMVPFAGYEMPVRYEPGPIAEHVHCRTAAALFDVSHMGIVDVHGPDASAALEGLVPAAITTLAPGRMRYTMLTNEAGGVLDDVMVGRVASRAGGAVDELADEAAGDPVDHLTLVVNAGGKEADVEHLRTGLPDSVAVELRRDLALLALQGPAAADVLARHDESIARLTFMATGTAVVGGIQVGVSRSGYTGEDGFELTVVADDAEALARALLAEPEVAPAGLAARDSLRLEAGLCLYGHDLDEATTPVEAGLAWSIQSRRRNEGGFPGATVILGQLADGPPRRRVGLAPHGRKPVRDGAALRTGDGEPVGTVTSGGYGPTVGAPIAMGYVASGHHRVGTDLVADVRGTDVACRVVDLPFVTHRYVRGA
jgi:aminomethyltransferase